MEFSFLIFQRFFGSFFINHFFRMDSLDSLGSQTKESSKRSKKKGKNAKKEQAEGSDKGIDKKAKWKNKKIAKLKQQDQHRKHLEDLQAEWDNSLILVQNLPQDITEAELGIFASKCGVIRKNPQTKNPFIYLDTKSLALPQAIVSYFRSESVDLATKILDGDTIRDGWSVSVTHFPKEKLTDEIRSALEPPKLKGLSNKVKLYDQSSELSWEEDENRVVILKHMFSPEEVDWTNAPPFFRELEVEIWQECAKYGEIEVLKIFENHPDGVVAIKYKDSRGAQDCIGAVDGRWFGGRKLEAAHYDGWTDYNVEESKEKQDTRIKAFGEWLGNEEEEEGEQKKQPPKKEIETEEDLQFD